MDRIQDIPQPFFSECAIDFASGRVIVENGQPKQIYGNEALRVWTYKALSAESQRFCYSAHSPQYGNELIGLVGGQTVALENRVKAMVRDALTVNPYIERVDDFSVVGRGSTLTAQFTVYTVFGDFRQERDIV